MKTTCRLVSPMIVAVLAVVATFPVVAADEAVAPSNPSTTIGEGAPSSTGEGKSNYVPPNMAKHAPYGVLKVVVPITTDNKKIQGMKLRNITNSLAAVEGSGGKFETIVVLYAKGLTLLENPDEKTQKQLDALVKKGVRVEVCNNSLKEQGVDFHALYHVTDADIIPSGFAEVAYLQARKHYVVDPFN